MSEEKISAEEMRRRVIEAQKSAIAAEVPTKREKLAEEAKKARAKAADSAKKAKARASSGAKEARARVSSEAKKIGAKATDEAKKARAKATDGAKKARAKAVDGAKKARATAADGAKKARAKAADGAKKARAKAADGAKKARERVASGAKKTVGRHDKGSAVGAFIDDLKYDVNAIMERDPAARSKLEAVLLYSGFHALAAHRVAHALDEKGAHFSARLISQATKLFTGIEIHPGATIGRGLFIDHGSGVVIGETSIIGDDCTIYQGATLGGTGKETGKRHPTLGDRVMVGAGAKLLGNFTVGSGSKIAAGAVVLTDVPENSTAVGIPAKVVKKDGVRVADGIDLDQTHIPDPVALRMDELQKKLDELEDELGEMKAAKKRAPKPRKESAEDGDNADIDAPSDDSAAKGYE